MRVILFVVLYYALKALALAAVLKYRRRIKHNASLA